MDGGPGHIKDYKKEGKQEGVLGGLPERLVQP
jgi:hypothetical protein